MSSFEPSNGPDREPIIEESDPAMWTRQRQDLRDWFRREAPSLAPAYEAAVLILHMSDMPAKVYIVSHLVRDIYNTLPEILNSEYRRKHSGAVYRDHVDKVERHWASDAQSSPRGEDACCPPTLDAEHAIVPQVAARAVESLLNKHTEIKTQPRSAEILANALYHRCAEVRQDAPRHLAKRLDREREWFTRRAHLVRSEDDIRPEDGLKEQFASFENALYSLVGQFFVGTKEIDDILQQANQATD